MQFPHVQQEIHLLTGRVSIFLCRVFLTKCLFFSLGVFVTWSVPWDSSSSFLGVKKVSTGRCEMSRYVMMLKMFGHLSCKMYPKQAPRNSISYSDWYSWLLKTSFWDKETSTSHPTCPVGWSGCVLAMGSSTSQVRQNPHCAITPFKLDNGWATSSTNFPSNAENMQFWNEFVSSRFNVDIAPHLKQKDPNKTPLGSSASQKFLGKRAKGELARGMSTANAVGCLGFGKSEGGFDQGWPGPCQVFKPASDKDVGKKNIMPRYVCMMFPSFFGHKQKRLMIYVFRLTLLRYTHTAE